MSILSKDDMEYMGFSMEDITKVDTQEIRREAVEVTLDKVRAGVENKRQTIVDILNNLLGDDECITVSMSKVVLLSGVSKKTFLKHLKSIRGVEFTLTNKGYGTEVRRCENTSHRV